MINTARQHSWVEWVLPYVRQLRLLRIGVLVVGLSLGLALAAVGPQDLLEAPFIFGVICFAVATGLTWTSGFVRLQPWTAIVTPLLDFATIGLWDLITRVEMVGAVVAFPAMWLGVTLGRRGVALAGTSSALLVVAPGLLSASDLTWGPPDRGWSATISLVSFSLIAAAGMAMSTEAWSRRLNHVEKQSAELESAVKAKGDFVGLVSHELRTPLTSILGYLDLIDDVKEHIPERALHHLAAVNRNAGRLLLLVTDLLSASEMENTTMRLALKPTDVAALAQLSLGDMDRRATEARLTLIWDLPPGIMISADPDRLLQVLDNLLSNAIKFTPPGGRISVTLLRHVDGVELVVRDTGVGIDADSLPHLATKFFRTPKTSQAAIPGIGLGLMITKTIIEAHHGTLTFTSREHEGTSAHVHLPKARSTHAPTPRPRLVGTKTVTMHHTDP